MNIDSMRDTISAINQIMEAGEEEHDYDKVDKQVNQTNQLAKAIQYVCANVDGISSYTNAGPISYNGGEGALYLIRIERYKLTLAIDTRSGFICRCRKKNQHEKLSLDLTGVIEGVTASNLMAKLVAATVQFGNVNFLRWLDPIYMLMQLVSEVNPSVRNAIHQLTKRGMGVVTDISNRLLAKNDDFDSKQARGDTDIQKQQAEFEQTDDELSIAAEDGSAAIAKLFGLDGEIGNIKAVGDEVRTRGEVQNDLAYHAQSVTGLGMKLNPSQIYALALASEMPNLRSQFKVATNIAFDVWSDRTKASNTSDPGPKAVYMKKAQNNYKAAVLIVRELIRAVIVELKKKHDDRGTSLEQNGALHFEMATCSKFDVGDGVPACDWAKENGFIIPKLGRPTGSVATKPKPTQKVQTKKPIAKSEIQSGVDQTQNNVLADKKSIINKIVSAKTARGEKVDPMSTLDWYNKSIEELQQMLDSGI